MDTEELVIYKGAEGKCLERGNRGFIKVEAVLTFTFKFKSEVFC